MKNITMLKLSVAIIITAVMSGCASAPQTANFAPVAPTMQDDVAQVAPVQAQSYASPHVGTKAPQPEVCLACLGTQ